MPVIWVVEIVFVAVVLAAVGIVAALRTRRELARISVLSEERLDSLRRNRERFNELKARFEQLQSDHGALSAEVDSLKKQSAYVDSVLANLGAGLPAAQGARAVLEAVAKGMREGADPAKTARMLIAQSMDAGPSAPPPKAEAAGKTVVSALTR